MGKNRVVYFQDAEEYAEKHFGKPISTKTIMNEKEKYAEIFSEGCQPLEKLLLKIWSEGYDTLACCKGHELPESYLKITGHKIKRMSAEEYHMRQNGSWFQKPRGFVRAPEFTHPYIELHNLQPKEVSGFRNFLKTNLDLPGNVEIIYGERSIRISFHNQYDAKSKRIDNTECWQQILDVVNQYFERLKMTWKEQVKETAGAEPLFLENVPKERQTETDQKARE